MSIFENVKSCTLTTHQKILCSLVRIIQISCRIHQFNKMIYFRLKCIDINLKFQMDHPGLTLSWIGLSVYCVKKSSSLLKTRISTKNLVNNGKRAFSGPNGLIGWLLTWWLLWTDWRSDFKLSVVHGLHLSKFLECDYRCSPVSGGHILLGGRCS